jgi:alkanesulfonate monooxygenase SsuD/methylene tetrahydromethanopterin reductase-like flavin-dependent oxidoreductase (luciferase family)
MRKMAVAMRCALIHDERVKFALVNELREQAQCADEYGWTSLMLAEHHFEVEGYQVTPNPCC